MAEIEGGREITVEVDIISEQVIIGAAIAGWDDGTANKLLKLFTPDYFLASEHAAIWDALLTMQRKKLSWDPATFRQISGDLDATKLVRSITKSRPDVPDNLDHHIEVMILDRSRATAIKGPIPALLAELRDPKFDMDKARSIAQQVLVALQSGARKYLYDPDELVRSQMRAIDGRVNGKSCYPYGIPGLDYYESIEAAATAGVVNPHTLADTKGRVRRCVPGSEPGYITLVSTMTGGGKSTFATALTMGIARQPKRKILYCAFEPKAGMTLESMTANSLGWSRTKLAQSGIQPGPDRDTFQERMELISKHVRFMGNPFSSKFGEDKKPVSNIRNLDVFANYVADSGCDAVVADLWKYMIVDQRPEAEEDALKYQQKMCEDLKFHLFLLQQQTHKKMELQQRQDKRPSREGIKGSGAYLEIVDTFLAPFIPSLWKPGIPRDKFEVFVLKQRYGLWPLGVEFDWEADIGRISGGRSIPYDQFEAHVGQSGFEDFVRPKKKGRK